MGKITAALLSNAAEGKYGSQIKAIYWALTGKKTLIAAACGFVAGAIVLAESTGLCSALNIQNGCVHVGEVVAKVSAAIAVGLGYLGQVDGALRSNPPQIGG